MKFAVAVDGSDQSDNAVSYAMNIAECLGASVTLLHSSVPEIYSEGGDMLIEDMSEAETRGETVLEDARAEAENENSGIDVATELLYGDPADEIVRYAEDEEFDAIYVGHRGMSQKQEDLMGSVAQEIVRRASIPVTVVR
ncbi:MAG: universal stress protein [Halobacteria archaeon]|nr:universal stress protein [Halobacteria archaeon]